jgi:hypothetical protein
MVNLPPRRPSRSLAISQDFPIPFPRKIDISLGSLPRSLFKGVQDVYSFFKLRDIEDSMLHAGVDAQLVNTGSYAGHGFPVIRLEFFLDQMQLVTGPAFRRLGESSQILQGGAYPEERFHGRRHYTKFCMQDKRP